MMIRTQKQITRLQKIALGIALLAGVFAPGLTLVAPVAHTYAQDTTVNCPGGTNPADPKNPCIGAAPGKATDPALATKCSNSDCGLIDKYLIPLINFLAGLVGIVVTVMIVVGGIQYSSSADDPQKVAAAKHRIINALLGLAAFLFLWVFLQWLVPGGFL